MVGNVHILGVYHDHSYIWRRSSCYTVIMSEARWSQRVTTEDGVFERRRCLTAEERTVMRKKYREEEEDVFQDIPRLFTYKDVPGFQDMLKKRLRALQEVFKKNSPTKSSDCSTVL